MSPRAPEPSAAVLGSGTMASRYAPIGEYGVIGDLYTVALVGMDGSIDFLCLPHFDSPSVFAALVDAERGGRFQIAPLLEGAARKQLYLPDTNVLLTRFLDASGVREASDFMPAEDAGQAHIAAPRKKLANVCPALNETNDLALMTPAAWGGPGALRVVAEDRNCRAPP